MTEKEQQVEVLEATSEYPKVIAAGAGGTEPSNEKRVTKLLGMQNVLNQIKNQRNQENEYRRMMLGDDAEGVAQVLDERLAEKSLEEIKKMSDDEITALFETEEGSLEINTAIFKDETKQLEYKRSVAVFLKEFAIINAEMDAETAKIEAEIEGSREEYQQIIEQFGSLEGYSRSIMERQINDPKTPPEQRERLLTIRQSMDDAITLRPIVEFYSANPSIAANTLVDFKSKSKAQDVYNRYKRVMVKLGNKQDLANYGEIEKLLDEKYHPYVGLLSFSIMRHLRYAKSPTRHQEGVLSAQICTTMLKLKQGALDETTATTFKASAQQLLDLFI